MAASVFTTASLPIHSLHEPMSGTGEASSPTSSSHSSSDEAAHGLRPTRPKLPSRKSSGTMIIPSNQRVQLEESEEEYEEGDVRCMSPRRSMEAVEKIGQDARQSLIEQAKTLQASLNAIVDRVETVKEEHEKLEGGNKFLQSYIGELIQTSKITSGPAKKGKRNAK